MPPGSHLSLAIAWTIDDFFLMAITVITILVS